MRWLIASAVVALVLGFAAPQRAEASWRRYWGVAAYGPGYRVGAYPRVYTFYPGRAPLRGSIHVMPGPPGRPYYYFYFVPRTSTRAFVRF